MAGKHCTLTKNNKLSQNSKFDGTNLKNTVTYCLPNTKKLKLYYQIHEIILETPRHVQKLNVKTIE